MSRGADSSITPLCRVCAYYERLLLWWCSMPCFPSSFRKADTVCAYIWFHAVGFLYINTQVPEFLGLQRLGIHQLPRDYHSFVFNIKLTFSRLSCWGSWSLHNTSCVWCQNGTITQGYRVCLAFVSWNCALIPFVSRIFQMNESNIFYF